MRKIVEFEGHGGTILRGWLYLPEGVNGTVPGIVMAHGLSATKEMGLEEFAAVFTKNGMSVLVYDHRNFGASDGEPRQEINPWAQARDYRYAIGWLSKQEQVDAERIGIWGSSFSGGEVIVVGACDDRVKAVAANVPLAGLDGIDYSDTQASFEAMRAVLLDDSGNGLADEVESAIGPMLIVKERSTDEAMLGQPESSEWYLDQGKRTNSRWQNSATLINWLAEDSLWDPAFCAAHVAPPLMMLVATEDTLCPTLAAKESFERASEPKELVMIEGHHFVPYTGEPFIRASGAACRFFKEHLGA